MKKQYQLREGEALHEWIDRLMETLTRQRQHQRLSDHHYMLMAVQLFSD